MKASREEMKMEAIRRLEVLEQEGLVDTVVKDFKNGILYYSEPTAIPEDSILGLLVSENERVIPVLYYLDNKKWLEKIKEVEEKYHLMVYHAVHYRAMWGEVLDLIYVGEDKDSWQTETDGKGFHMIYAWNITEDSYSELGGAEYKSLMGGVMKVA